ncbi:MAG: hypothetical protein ACTSYA_01420 [Candidatus Kariarchaeaceae archaeon]
MQLQNNLHKMKKLKVAILSALFATLFISNITLSSADDLGIGSDLTIGNNSGYVQASSNTEMYFYAENDTDPIAGASIEIQVTGAGDLGRFLDDTTYHSVGAYVSFGSTDSAGEFTFIWETPAVSGTETVTFAVIAHHETEELYLGEQVIVITNDAVDLTSFDLITDNEAYSEEIVTIDAIVFSIDGGNVDNIEIEFSTLFPGCTFSESTVNTNALGKASTEITLPAVVFNSVAAVINASAVLNSNGLIFQASTIINIHPYDLNDSRIEAVTEVTADDTILVTIVSEGTYGVIANASVNVGATIGDFNVTDVYTNETGEVVIEWTADSTLVELDAVLHATITKGVTIAITLNVTIHPIYYTIETLVNATTLEVNQTLKIDIAIKYQTSGVEGAFVIVDTLGQGGYFISTDTDEIEGVTAEFGLFTCYWVADLIPIEVIGSDILFTVQTYDASSALSNSTFNIHINPIDVGFTTTFEANETFIYYTQSVNFSLELLLNDAGYEGAVVTIESLVGTFEGSGTTQRQRITNENGEATFTWNPTGLGNPTSPQVLNFTLEISITEHALILYDWVIVTVVPEGYSLEDGTPPATDPSGTDDPSDSSGVDDEVIIVIAGAVIVTIIIGGAIVLVRKS